MRTHPACILIAPAATTALAQPAFEAQAIPGGSGIPVSRVQGRVTLNGLPAEGARVTLFVPSLAFFRETRTSENGTYAFAAGAPSTYKLGVTALGCEYEEINVTVNGGRIIRDFALEPESQPGRWDIIGNTLPEFFDATDIAYLLPDGRVFFCHDTDDPILFNPITGQKAFPASSGSSQGCMNGSLLPDGRLIMVGGQDGADPGSFRNAVRWVKAYNVATDSWVRLADLQNPTGRWYPGLARLADGSLLAMGGGTRPDAARTPTCERLNLSTLTWSYTGSMLNASEFTPSALLHTGEVLITWSPPQLYNPGTGQWRATGNFVQPNRGWPDHSDHSLIMLDDGRALAVGIRGQSNTTMGEVYNPGTGSWSLTSNAGLPRFQCEVVQMPDGRVLAAGGEAKEPNPPVPQILGIVKWCETYDPAVNAWRRVADMNWFREYHAVTVLIPDGRIVMTGGTRIKFQYGPTSADIEAFSPPYLFRGVRPQITDISSTTLSRGAAVSIEIFPDTRITSVVLMGVETTTHWVNGGIPRRLLLPVAQLGSTVMTALPSAPNTLPLGYYMLFAMVDDVPSVARVIKVQ